jgi:predicted ArsR family transcriptional regulator
VYDQKLFSDYLRKCFVSVDGLWFMKIEEDAGFEKALEIDIAVWKVLPKIEARTIQELLSLGRGIEALHAGLDFKLSAERYSHALSPVRQDAFTLEVHDCPWVQHIKKAGRARFLERIAASICPAEYGAFTAEFGKSISIEHQHGDCAKHGKCRFVFQLKTHHE